jgi:hypothetical protein
MWWRVRRWTACSRSTASPPPQRLLLSWTTTFHWVSVSQQPRDTSPRLRGAGQAFSLRQGSVYHQCFPASLAYRGFPSWPSLRVRSHARNRVFRQTFTKHGKWQWRIFGLSVAVFDCLDWDCTITCDALPISGQHGAKNSTVENPHTYSSSLPVFAISLWPRSSTNGKPA